jgi:urease accessory protein
MTVADLSPALPKLQRAAGVGRLSAKSIQGATKIAGLFQQGCAQIRAPKDSASSGLEAVLINTSGGMTGGDRLDWRLDAEPGARLTVTTQACEKFYRARDGQATIAVSLNAAAGASIDWLPQETIIFDGGALSRTLSADLAADARLLVVDAVVLGRTRMGEVVRTGLLRDQWRIRRNGRLVFADDLRLEGQVNDICETAATLAGAKAFATLLLAAADAERFLAPLRDALSQARGFGGDAGASQFDGKLFARLVAPDSLSLRKSLLPAIAVLRDGRACPRVWGF